MTRRSVIVFMSIAIGASMIGVGCGGGGEQIPLAKFEPSGDSGKKGEKVSPKTKGSSSPTELIYK